MKKYRYTVVFEYEAPDDAEARRHTRDIEVTYRGTRLEGLPVEKKLQELKDGQPPRKVNPGGP